MTLTGELQRRGRCHHRLADSALTGDEDNPMPLLPAITGALKAIGNRTELVQENYSAR